MAVFKQAGVPGGVQGLRNCVEASRLRRCLLQRAAFLWRHADMHTRRSHDACHAGMLHGMHGTICCCCECYWLPTPNMSTLVVLAVVGNWLRVRVCGWLRVRVCVFVPRGLLTTAIAHALCGGVLNALRVTKVKAPCDSLQSRFWPVVCNFRSSMHRHALTSAQACVIVSIDDRSRQVGECMRYTSARACIDMACCWHSRHLWRRWPCLCGPEDSQWHCVPHTAVPAHTPCTAETKERHRQDCAAHVQHASHSQRVGPLHAC